MRRELHIIAGRRAAEALLREGTDSGGGGDQGVAYTDPNYGHGAGDRWRRVS